MVLLLRISARKEYCASTYKGHETNRPAASGVHERQQTWSHPPPGFQRGCHRLEGPPSPFSRDYSSSKTCLRPTSDLPAALEAKHQIPRIIVTPISAKKKSHENVGHDRPCRSSQYKRVNRESSQPLDTLVGHRF